MHLPTSILSHPVPGSFIQGKQFNLAQYFVLVVYVLCIELFNRKK